MVIHRNILRTIIQSDFQVTVNANNKKIGAPKDNINLVKDIKNLLTRFFKSILKYCSKLINRYADALVKMAHVRL